MSRVNLDLLWLPQNLMTLLRAGKLLGKSRVLSDVNQGSIPHIP